MLSLGTFLQRCGGHQSTVAEPLGAYENYNFHKNRKSHILGVWAAPGGRGDHPKGGGRSPQSFGRVSRAPGAAQTHKMSQVLSL